MNPKKALTASGVTVSRGPFFFQVIKLPLVRLEMRYLSKVTGDEVFASKTMKFYVRILKLLALLDNLLFGKRNRIIITK